MEREGQRYSASELELNKMKSFPCQLQGGLNLRERQASFGYTSGSYTSTSVNNNIYGDIERGTRRCYEQTIS